MVQFGDALGSEAWAWPGGLDTRMTFQNHSNAQPDGVTRLDAEIINQILGFLLHLEAEFGTQPNGAFQTLQDRLDRFLPTALGALFDIRNLPSGQTVRFVNAINSGGTTGSGFITLDVGGQTRFIHLQSTS